MLPSPTTLITKGHSYFTVGCSYYDNTFLGRYFNSTSILEAARDQALWQGCSKISSKITEYSVQRIASDAFQSIALCFILRPKQLIAFNFTVNYLPTIFGLCGCQSLYFRIYCLVSVILSGLLAGIKSGVKKGHAQVTTLDLTDRSLQFFDDLRQTPATINKIILSGALFTSNHLAQIPESACHINLSNHNFIDFDLQQIPHAEIIDLSNCDLTQTNLTNPSKNLKTLILTNSLLNNDQLLTLPSHISIIH